MPVYAYPNYHNYDLDPQVTVTGHDGAVRVGWDALLEALLGELAAGHRRLCFELYPGVDEEDILRRLEEHSPEVMESSARNIEHVINILKEEGK